MTSRKELKSIAREALKGRWGIAIGLSLMIFAISILLCMIPFIGWLVFFIIYPSILYILPQIFFSIKRNEHISANEIFNRIFKNLKTYWGIALRTLQKLIPFILMYVFVIILVGISETKESLFFEILVTFVGLIAYILLFIQSLYYSQAIYIITDNPTMSCKEAVIKSKELMTGHRFEYFVLTLSFFGWATLAYLTCGLGSLYLFPYMSTTYAAYYDELAGINSYTETNNDDVIQF